MADFDSDQCFTRRPPSETTRFASKVLDSVHAGQAGRVHSVAFARLELAAVFHRHLREGRLRPRELGARPR